MLDIVHDFFVLLCVLLSAAYGIIDDDDDDDTVVQYCDLVSMPPAVWYPTAHRLSLAC